MAAASRNQENRGEMAVSAAAARAGVRRARALIAHRYVRWRVRIARRILSRISPRCAIAGAFAHSAPAARAARLAPRLRVCAAALRSARRAAASA